MANIDKAFGLKPHSSLNGGPWNGNVRQFFIPASDSTAVYVGDLVKLAGTEGSLNPDDLPFPTVTKAASTDVMVGVVVGILPVPGDLDVQYRKASTAQYVLVDVDPNTIYLIQGDADVYDAADVGLNMNVTVAAGSSVTGVSKTVADQSTAATTATLDLQVLGSAPIVDNDLTGGYPLLLVRLNNCQYVDGTTGV